LHPEHADFISDFRRFTNSYIIKLEADIFKKIKIIPMGGVFAVIYDILLTRYKKRMLIRFLLFPIYILAMLEREDEKICTGFLIVFEKIK
jgi:hypothetical protein